MLTIGRALAARDHRVTVLTGRKYGAAVQSFGLSFLPLPAEIDYDDANLGAWLPGRDRYKGIAAGRAITSPNPPRYDARVEEGDDLPIPADAAGIMAPVSGTVWKLLVAAGQSVEEGTELLLIEAMKMEIPVVAEESGEIIEVRVTQGSSVNAGDVLVVIRPTRKSA